jgi:hypothetical protein
MPAHSLPNRSAVADLVAQQLRRLQRVVGFTSALVTALEGEFAPLRSLAPADLREAAARPVLSRLDRLATLLAEAARILAHAETSRPAEAFSALATVDLDALVRDAMGLQALARTLRHDSELAPLLRFATPSADQGPPRAAAAPRPGPAEASPSRPAGTRPLDLTAALAPLLRVVRELLPGPVEAPGDPPPAPPPDPRAAALSERARREQKGLRAACRLANDIAEHVAGRIGAIRIALELARPRGVARPCQAIHDEAPERFAARDIPAEHQGIILALALLFALDARAAQAAQVACVQFDGARALLAEASVLAEAVRKVPDPEALRLLRDFNVSRLKGVVLPLTHLHLSFRGLRLLADLFPAPELAEA